jgi:hypothetical protein
MAQLWSRPAEPPIVPRTAWDVGAVSIPVHGETQSGDGWAFATAAGLGVMLTVDGLGHGPVAAEVAREAIRVFGGALAGASSPMPGELLARIHQALRKTRGGAVAIAILDPLRREIRFAGVGNISASVAASTAAAPPAGEDRSAVVAGQRSRSLRSGLSSGTRGMSGGASGAGTSGGSMVSHNGTVGAEMRKVQEFVYPWPKGAAVIMHSDGIATHWDLANYPGLASRRAPVIAGVLYRDHHRLRDDATVLVVREGGAS